MSIDRTSDSKNLNKCEVTSKYFADKGVMDESLSDFQEKKNFACAKNSQKAQKPSTSKPKPKKTIKKIRGQKDIRTVLKKKNELIAYSNDFDKICKQSGIDVDSEQLQLAIALSKSLQETETKTEAETSTPLTTQERTGKIRTTLLEYGFVVPEVKITATKRRKQKKYRKHYKLIHTTEEEKQQIISDKYSQVLFQNLDNNKETNCSDNKNTNTAQLYHLGTNISYEELKDDNLLYVEDLLEKSPSCVGCLLKNWAEIPGRPISPTLEQSSINFEKVDCTQEELDTILSGLIKTAQDIVKNNYRFEEPVIPTNKSESFTKDTEQLKMDTDCVEILEEEEAESKELGMTSKEKVIDVENSNLLMVTQKVRSCSPDIFDDEVSEILDTSSPDVIISQEISKVEKTKQCSEIMDLTECLNVNSQAGVLKPTLQLTLSQGNQTLKRRSSEFMDITECVVGSSQAIRENVIAEENIDLTQNSDEENLTERITKTQDVQKLDLTQSSDTNEELPEVQISSNKSLEDTIIVNEDVYTEQLNTDKDFLGFKKCREIDKDMNNGSTSYSENLQPTNKFSSQDRVSITIDSEDESEEPLNKQNEKPEVRAISPIEFITEHNELEFSRESLNNSIETLNRAKEHSKYTKGLEHNVTKSKTESFFEEFVHRHSESSSKENTDLLSVDEASKHSINDDNNSKNENDGIDLTQDTSSSEEVTEPTKNNDSPKISFESSHLGKIGDVSIDYDELYDDLVRSHNSLPENISSKSNKSDFNSESYTEKPSNSDLVSNSSQNSEAFEISDKELDYSINKSRMLDNPKDNFDFGGISVVDNLPDLPSFRPSTVNFENRSLNRSLSESYLPVVEVKGRIEKENKSKSNSTSPNKISREEIVAKTPKNGEYIIKTDGVTPMADYERMSTPERNAELDKYGIKPFKRKRAIQLLTHLYNQTHPIVESLEIDPTASSPSKRFKPSINPDISPTKRKSPKKKSVTSKSPKKVCKSTNVNANKEREDELEHIEVSDKENDIYVVTNEVPDIRDIECCEEDWVFQKREKAKLHSCRVPLHISFHNYVASRRKLREAILRYEPVNIDDIHKGLVKNGFRYDPKDLLKFLDKKCITVKTADNNGRNKKHY